MQSLETSLPQDMGGWKVNLGVQSVEKPVKLCVEQEKQAFPVLKIECPERWEDTMEPLRAEGRNL